MQGAAHIVTWLNLSSLSSVHLSAEIIVVYFTAWIPVTDIGLSVYAFGLKVIECRPLPSISTSPITSPLRKEKMTLASPEHEVDILKVVEGLPVGLDSKQLWFSEPILIISSVHEYCTKTSTPTSGWPPSFVR